MSILQEYEEHSKILGQKTINAISEYLHSPENNNGPVYYSDIIYKKAEWEKFEKWYNDKYGKSSERNRKVQ